MNWKVSGGVVVVAMVLVGCPVVEDDLSCDAGCYGDEYCDLSSKKCANRFDAGVGDGGLVDGGLRTDGGAPDGGSSDAGTPDAGVDAGTLDGGGCVPSTVCRGSAGPCDVEELCGADGGCPEDGFLVGDVCNSVECGLAHCTGASAECPTSFDVAPVGTVCRPAAGDCDVAETCSGSSLSCPGDVRVANGTVCRPQDGACDIAEACVGTPQCPPDGVRPSGNVCRGTQGVCDTAETCDGVSKVCPPDRVRDAGSACGSSTNTLCDPADSCDGVGTACVTRYADAGTVCDVPINSCLTTSLCNGSGSCLLQGYATSGTVCAGVSYSGPPLGPADCDGPDTCSGGDSLACDAPYYCSGISSACTRCVCRCE